MRRGITTKFAMRKVWNDALNWVFPNDDQACAICMRPMHISPIAQSHALNRRLGASMRSDHLLEDVLCPFCQQELSRCTVEAETQHLRIQARKRRVLDVASCVAYDAFIRTLFRSFKYDGLVDLVPFFGGLLTRRFAGGEFPAFDAIVPVPSTADRTRKRGYDHVRLLADYLSAQIDVRCQAALTRRPDASGFTQSQTAKSAIARKRGLENVYGVDRQSLLAGKRILLVDDIVTTGATLAACSERIYQAGARNVCALVIARVR